MDINKYDYTLVEESDVQSFQESGITDLFKVLCKGLYHCTSIENYYKIVEDGFLRPNEGQFNFTFPQSENSFGYSKGCISLFDFESTREEYAISQHMKWRGFFICWKPATILLNFCHQFCKDKLIPNSSRPRPGDKNKNYKNAIPYVEVWYPEPIPVKAIQNRIIVCPGKDINGKIYFRQYDKDDLSNFENDLVSIINEERNLKRKKGTVSPKSPLSMKDIDRLSMEDFRRKT
ncbi:MAG: hypothetical protein KAT34_19560 [Candidatus Aminicenantes bacterium]|nr:hypothetical protein [Candidatus Aminicenantes bacterium]